MVYVKTLVVLLAVLYVSEGRSVSKNDDIGINLDELVNFLEGKDPFKIEEWNLPLESYVIKGIIRLEKVNLEGFSDIPRREFDYPNSTNKLKVGLTLPKVQLSTGYRLINVLLFNFVKLYGKGDLSISLENVKLDLETRIVIKSGRALGVADTKLTLKLDPKISLTGFLNNDDHSKLISDQLESLLNYAIDELLPANVETLENLVNFLLSS